MIAIKNISLFHLCFFLSFALSPWGQKNWLKFKMTAQGEWGGEEALSDFRVRTPRKRKKRESYTSPEWELLRNAFWVAIEWWILGLWKWKEKCKEEEWKRQSGRRRTVVEGLRAKLESMWRYQSHRSSREKLLTGAHRALIDCELCCRAQPITRAPGDFSGLEHLHAVCRPIRETTQREESERDRKRGEKNKEMRREGGVSWEREKWDFRIMVWFFSSWWPWNSLLWDLHWSEYTSSVLSFASFVCPVSLCLPFIRLSLTPLGSFSTWQYVVCMTFKGTSHGIKRRFEHCNSVWHFVRRVLNGQILLTGNFWKILQNIRKPPDTSLIQCRHSSQRKYTDKIIFL